jgi:hypothetical protein
MSSIASLGFSFPSIRLYLWVWRLRSVKGMPSVNVGRRFVFFQKDSLVKRCLVCLSGSSGMNKVLEFGTAFGSRVLNLNACTNFSSPAIVKNLCKV